jgi:hypothetical protein
MAPPHRPAKASSKHHVLRAGRSPARAPRSGAAALGGCRGRGGGGRPNDFSDLRGPLGALGQEGQTDQKIDGLETARKSEISRRRVDRGA